jgi:predicted DNA-binding transcriptional regulator YafY
MVLTSARLLRLLTLLQSRGFWTGRDLAERLEVTERTVRRDVDRLRSLGYPIRSSTGVAGGYQLGAGASLPPLLLEDDEALAVTLGLRTATAGTVAGLEEPALRALAKLEQMMPQRLRRRVAALSHAVAPLYHEGPRADAIVLSTLAGACRNAERASFRYETAERATRRSVEPYGLVHTGSRWYLAAWDEDRRDWRTFRLDRIVGAVKTGSRFSARPIPGGDASRYVARSVASQAYPHRVRVVLHASKSVVARVVPPAAAVLQEVGGDRCRMETGGRSLERIAVWILAVGHDFEVEEPPELLEALRTLGRRIRRATRR